MKIISYAGFVLQMISIFCCCDIIQYSPYEADIKNKHSNSDEINRIKKKKLNKSDTLRFAFLTDNHDNYDDLDKAVTSINKQKELMFVVCGGDITDGGLVQQYNWYVDIIKKCKYPFLTIIGNHDYLANGQVVFGKIFGSTNYSFILEDYKFIFFDDIIQENRFKGPQYQWLKNECADTVHHQVFIAHIPHWSGLISGYHNIIFWEILKPERILLCLYGHNHTYTEENDYNNLKSIVGNDIEGKEYYIVSLIGDNASIKRVNY